MKGKVFKNLLEDFRREFVERVLTLKAVVFIGLVVSRHLDVGPLVLGQAVVRRFKLLVAHCKRGVVIVIIIVVFIVFVERVLIGRNVRQRLKLASFFHLALFWQLVLAFMTLKRGHDAALVKQVDGSQTTRISDSEKS
jgi:hypothetical protein